MDCDQAVEIVRELDAAGRLSDRNDLARALMNRGDVLKKLDRLAEALDEYKNASLCWNPFRPIDVLYL